LSWVFDADEIDEARRAIGQTQTLAHSGYVPAIRDQVLELHEQGLGPSRIAREVSLSRKQVERLLSREGISRERSVPASTFRPQILELKRQGMSNAEIGRLLGFSRKAISRAIRSPR
jgi:DNA-binding NarL/FixJ family response regulator